MGGREAGVVFESRFDDANLDRSLWLPYYLPQWTGRATAAARYRIDDGLVLRIDEDQPAWHPDGDPPIRVSSLQTGVRSGPVGSGDGQHRYREGLTVVETQNEERLFLPDGGRVEVRARAHPDPNVMVALWLIGFEERPDESAELCVMEIFGREIEHDRGLVGMGIHPWHDEALVDDFEKLSISSDLTGWHEYAVTWMPGRAEFFVDDLLVKVSSQAPDYPMQLMLGIFELEPGGEYPKEFEVAHVLGFEAT